MENFLIVSKQIGQIVFFVAVGIMALKIKLVKEEALDSLAKIIINITLPLSIFTRLVQETTAEDIMGSLSIILIALCINIFLFLCAVIASRALRLEGDRGNLFRCMTMFGNSIFIGMPLITSLFPEKGVLYVSLYNLVDQVLVWTLGVKLTTHVEEKRGAGDNKERDMLTAVKAFVKNITTPALMSIVLGIAFVFMGIRIPEPINAPLASLGNITTPLSMIYLGAFMATFNIGHAFKNLSFYIMSFIKLLLVPTLVFLVLALIGYDPDVGLALCMIAGLPTMISVVMLSNLNGSDGEYACSGLTVITILSIFTLPALSIIFDRIVMLLG